MTADDGWAQRQLVRVGNFEITHASFQWIDDFRVEATSQPTWALSIERLEKGPFYGDLEALLIDGKVTASTPAEAWQKYGEIHPEVRSRWQQSVSLRKNENGAVQRAERNARLAQTQAQLDHGKDSPQYAAAVEAYKATEVWGRMRMRRLRPKSTSSPPKTPVTGSAYQARARRSGRHPVGKHRAGLSGEPT